MSEKSEGKKSSTLEKVLFVIGGFVAGLVMNKVTSYWTKGSRSQLKDKPAIHTDI